MKISEIRKLSTEDLTKQSSTLRTEIVNLRRKVHLGEISNVRIIRKNRKELARILTVLSEKLVKEIK
ncbi:MAG: 50S ribosomal protein L29 [Patescibacteria group bacterium]|jgi:large subunit ribosomal protein L29|nr:50S ribosomal protein L29 [Patescibacteria group bacterium]